MRVYVKYHETYIPQIEQFLAHSEDEVHVIIIMLYVYVKQMTLRA